MMPEISRFFGIIITMNYNDHLPPHFHARYGGDQAIIDIQTLQLLGGHLGPRVMGLVIEWALLHRDELLEDWRLARESAPLKRIAPLEQEGKMPNDVVKVEPRGGYRLWLQFQDGVEGEVDLAPKLTFQGVFAPLRDPAYFARVRVNPELGTICWPNDADWDPLVLYSLVTGRPIETLLARSRNANA